MQSFLFPQNLKLLNTLLGFLEDIKDYGDKISQIIQKAVGRNRKKNVLKGEGMVQSEMQKRTRMKHIMLWNETREIKY